jgi:hypothetical protein
MTQLENFGGENVSIPIDPVSDLYHHREIQSHTKDGDSQDYDSPHTETGSAK